MLSEVIKDIYKISGISNIYYLKEHQIIIDAGSLEDKEVVRKNLMNLTDLKAIKKVIFTHLHYDHISNFDLFPNARFFASKKEIDNLEKDPLGTVLNKLVLNNFRKIKLQELTEKEIPENLKIITCPGHTSGSIAIYDKKNKLLFSGDTLFYNLVIGRYDLPTSSPKDMNKSLEKLTSLEINCLCPGHNY